MACVLPSTPYGSHAFRDENEKTRMRSRRVKERRKIHDAELWSSAVGPQTTNAGLRILYPWLDAKTFDHVPRSMKVGIESSAVDRFFTDWVVDRVPNGSSGYSDCIIPKLYFTAPPLSPLSYIVHAIAYANIRCPVEAGKCYGSALKEIRAALARGTDDYGELSSDHLLASLLLVHDFEVMYLKSHLRLSNAASQAMTHLLHIRNDSQLFDSTSFRLSFLSAVYILKHRLVRGEKPPDAICNFLAKLNVKMLDNRILDDAFSATKLCAAARSILSSTVMSPDHLLQADKLVERMQCIAGKAASLCEISNYSSQASQKLAVLSQKPTNNIASSAHPFTDYAGLDVLLYPDIWVGFKWIFYASFQIALRDCIIRLRQYISINSTSWSPEDCDVTSQQQNELHKLSSSFVRSLPTCLGFMDQPKDYPHGSGQGIAVRRCTAFLPMNVVLRTDSISMQQKTLVEKALVYIYDIHALEI